MKTHNLVFVMFDGQRRTFADLTGLQEPPEVSDFHDAAEVATKIDKNIHRWVVKPVPSHGEYYCVIKPGDRWHGKEVAVVSLYTDGRVACALSSVLSKCLQTGTGRSKTQIRNFTTADIW